MKAEDLGKGLEMDARDLVRTLFLIVTVKHEARVMKRFRRWQWLIHLACRLAGIGGMQTTPDNPAARPLMSIADTPARCPACTWEGRAGECEPDVDGDGSLGCPRCNAVVLCQGDGDPPPERPGKEAIRTSMLHCGRCGDNLIWPMPGMVVKCTCGAVRVSRDP